MIWPKKPTEEEMNRLIEEMVKLSNAEEWEALKTKADDFIEKFRNEAEGYFFRGTAEDNLGHHKEAIKDFDMAIELDPEDSAIYNNRSATRNNLGRHKEAIKDSDKAIELDPKNSAAYNNRGLAKNNLSRHEEAIKDLDRAIELNPNDSLAYNNRGNAKYSLGHHEEAIKDYDKAIVLNPNNANAYNGRGTAKAQLEDYTEAIKDYDKAIELDDQKLSYYHNRALAIGTFQASETKRKLIESYEEQIRETGDPVKLIELFDRDISKSEGRLYGETTSPNDPKLKTIGWIDEARNAAKNLCIAIPIIVTTVFAITFLELNYLPNEFKFRDPTSLRLIQSTSLFLLISSPFFLNARHLNRRANEELVRLHAIKRDRNLILIWNAKKLEGNDALSGKLFDQMTYHSTADISLKMMHPKHAGRHQETDQGLTDKIADLVKRNPPPDTP